MLVTFITKKYLICSITENLKNAKFLLNLFGEVLLIKVHVFLENPKCKSNRVETYGKTVFDCQKLFSENIQVLFSERYACGILNLILAFVHLKLGYSAYFQNSLNCMILYLFVYVETACIYIGLH